MAEQARMPTGVSVETEEFEGPNGPTWTWKLRSFGKVVGKGNAETAKEAKNAAWAAFRELAESKSLSRKDKLKWRMKLKYMTETRPYLICGVIESVLGGADLARAMREAEDGEKAWWSADKSKYRYPLPTHHRAKKPYEVARDAYECFDKLGMLEKAENGSVVKVPGLRKWANSMFGEDSFPLKG